MTARVERKVFFYRANIQVDEDAIDVAVFDPVDVANRIIALAFDTGERYLSLGEGNSLCVWPIRSRHPVRFCVGTVRRSSLPQLEEEGKIAPLAIAENQGLLERTHCVFFPNAIVGAEFNFYGPRMSALARYIHKKCPALPEVRFEPLWDRDVLAQLRHAQDLRLLDLKIHRSHLDLLAAAGDNLPDALQAACERLDAPVVELILRQEPHSQRSLSQRARAVIRAIVGAPANREHMERCRVQGLDQRTGKVEWFDLLMDKFIVTRTVTKQDERYRAVDSDSMFDEIEAAYAPLQRALEEAASAEG